MWTVYRSVSIDFTLVPKLQLGSEGKVSSLKSKLWASVKLKFYSDHLVTSRKSAWMLGHVWKMPHSVVP